MEGLLGVLLLLGLMSGPLGPLVLRAAGTEMEMGFKLHPAFIAAGLPAPSMRTERPISGGSHYPGYYYLAGLIRGVLPMMEQLGVATAGEMGIETLVERLRHEVVGLGGVIAFPSITGAWIRKPVEQGNSPGRDLRRRHPPLLPTTGQPPRRKGIGTQKSGTLAEARNLCTEGNCVIDQSERN